MIGVIFNKGMIVRSKSMNGDKIFICFRNIKDIVQGKITIRGTNKTLTNLTDSHTCTVGSMHLISATIRITCGELLKFADYVVGGTGICIPVHVDAV